jgi:hypothetical protein
VERGKVREVCGVRGRMGGMGWDGKGQGGSERERACCVQDRHEVKERGYGGG